MAKYDDLKMTANKFLALKRAGKVPSYYKNRLTFSLTGDDIVRRIGKGDNGELYLENFDGWRKCGDATDITSHLPLGYYMDSYQDATVIACVVQLPARDGVPQYYPAVRFSDADGVTVYSNDVKDNARDAAYVADRYTQLIADDALWDEYEAQLRLKELELNETQEDE